MARYEFCRRSDSIFSTVSTPISSLYHTHHTGRSTLPTRVLRQNLGYVAQATLNIPVWTWGAIRSKVKQAELKREQAQLDLTLDAAHAARQCGGLLRRGARRAGAARFAARVD